MKKKDTKYEFSAPESLLNSTLEALNMPAAIIDCGFVYQAVNEAYKTEFYEIFGLKIQVGNNLNQLLAHLPKEQTTVKHIFQRALDGESFNLAMKFGDPSIRRRMYYMGFKPLFDHKKNVIATLQTDSLITDSAKIQEHQQLLREKKEQEHKFKNALDSMLDGVIIFDPSGKIIYNNKQANTILNNCIANNRLELLDNVLFEDEEGNLLETNELASSKAFQGKNHRKKNFRIRIKGHEPIWIDSSSAPIYNQQKELFGLILNFRDITEEVNSREALRESETRFHIMAEKLRNEHDLLKKIIDTIPIMISIYEPDINVVYLNKAIEKVTGWTNEDAEIYGIMNLAYPDPEYREAIGKYMQSLKPGFKDIKMTCKNGMVKDTSWANIHIPDGRHVGIGIDLSDIKHYEKELVNNNLELQQKNAQLKRFSDLMENLLYMAAHDLKSPIGNLQLMMYLIGKEESLEGKLEYLPDFDKMVKRLNSVIDGLIEIIESQQEHDTLVARKINIGDCIKDVQVELKDELEQSQGTITYQIDCNPKIHYITAFFQSILKNLLTNSIKYRDKSRKLLINIKVEKRGDFTLMTVKDNGIGFDVVRNKKNLFRPFKRFTNTGSGTGIGLYIIKSFIEKNGGYIEVDSTVNKGTCFYCYLKEYDQERITPN
jgi:PAS domain S-box-containing protein